MYDNDVRGENFGHQNQVLCIIYTHTCVIGHTGAPSGCTLPFCHHEMKTSNHTISVQLPPLLTRIASTAVHQGGGVRHATGASSKIHGRDNITIGT